MFNPTKNFGLYHRDFTLLECDVWSVQNFHAMHRAKVEVYDAATAIEYGKKCLRGEIRNAGFVSAIEALRLGGLGTYQIHQMVNAAAIARNKSFRAKLSWVRIQCEQYDKALHANFR